jgi:hypothetical protein
LSRLLNSLKGCFRPRLRQEFPGHIRKYLWDEHFWSPSYSAGSCAGAPPSIVKDYIEPTNAPPNPAPTLRADTDNSDAIPPGRQQPGFLARAS